VNLNNKNNHKKKSKKRKRVRKKEADKNKQKNYQHPVIIGFTSLQLAHHAQRHKQYIIPVCL
jgi:hypothetical protein